MCELAHVKVINPDLAPSKASKLCTPSPDIGLLSSRRPSTACNHKPSGVQERARQPFNRTLSHADIELCACVRSRSSRHAGLEIFGAPREM